MSRRQTHGGVRSTAADTAEIGVVVDGIWTFLAITAVLSLSPGPDDVLVLRSSLAGGPRLGMLTVAGVASGSLAWGAATAVGFTTVVAGSEPLLDALRLAGAGYLVLLGAVPLVADVAGRARGVPALAPGVVPRARAPGSARHAFSTGLMSDLLNPKIGLFYVAVLPQFVPSGASTLQYSLLLCAIDIAVAVTWLTGLTCLACAAVNWLLRPRLVQWTQRIVSTSLIGLGASTALGF